MENRTISYKNEKISNVFGINLDNEKAIFAQEG
jgi:hypothetical protein